MRSAFDHQVFAVVPTCGPGDVVPAVARARDACAYWSVTATERRLRVLSSLRRSLAVGRRPLRAALVHGCGLGPMDADAELALANRFLSHSRSLVHAHYGVPSLRKRTSQALRRTQGRGGDPRRSPAVVCATADTARPLMSLLESVAPALARGSGVLTALDAPAAVVAAQVLRFSRTAGLPDGVWQLLVPADPSLMPVVRALLSEHTDALAPRCCAPRTEGMAGPSGLTVVRHDANVARAARAAATACFERAGRLCSATPLVAVHKDCWEPFLAEFVTAVARVGGRSRSDSVLLGPQAERLGAWYTEALSAGAQWTGRPPMSVSQPPGILAADISGAQGALRRVPPGPVALLLRYTAWAEVLDLARHTNRHLGLFTRTSATQLRPQFAMLPSYAFSPNTSPRAGLGPASQAAAETEHE
ncbi:aldehyde dehydrogenase family protein [Streptomyces syringium]|uniref:aldehyde dehydrogenase family protein n=1 Tax=Streptomyces syringium TaxID=76729 RepID=UPI0033D70C72